MTVFAETNVDVDLRMLRSFRVLRPLKLVSKIPSESVRVLRKNSSDYKRSHVGLTVEPTVEQQTTEPSVPPLFEIFSLSLSPKSLSRVVFSRQFVCVSHSYEHSFNVSGVEA